MANIYTLDGFPLSDPGGRWVTENETGLRIIPARTALGASVPGRDGVRASLGSSFEAGAVGIRVAVMGADYASMLASVELLSGVLGQRHKLLTLRHHVGGAQDRVALVEVLASTTPELVATENAIIDVQCSVPGAFWRSVSNTDSAATIANTASTQTLVELAGSTGPITDALLQFEGGFSTATITCPVSGDSLTINAPLADGEYVVVDTANWVARKHTTDSWSLTAGTNWITNVVSNRGSGPMLTLNPDFTTGEARVRATTRGTNTTLSPGVTVRAKRSFI